MFIKNLFETVALLRFHLGRTEIEEFLKEFTAIADFCIEGLYDELGIKVSVASLGKHGSREMNVGSDLDLIFFSLKREKENGYKAVLELIGKLENLGYEVDTRLRPFGEKGELIFTLDYFKTYVEEVGRLWERLAFTRFRFLKGALKRETEKVVEHFLFSKGLRRKDIEEIKLLRERLERELSKSPLGIKYERGGVVDVEFVAYVYQLLFREKWGNTFSVLSRIKDINEDFKEGVELYKRLRTAELEKRLFGKYTTSEEEILKLKEETRNFYRRFMKWAERILLSM